MNCLRISKILQIISAGICYFLFGLGAVIVGLAFRVIGLFPFISPAKKQRYVRKTIQLGCLAFIKTMRLFGLIRYKFDVESMLTAVPGHVVVSNHPSLIDVVLLFAVNKDLNCIVKSALWDNFFTGAVVKQAGFIPNNPDSVDAAVEKLHSGENLLIFPEGTRTDDEEHLRFKRGASNVAVAAQCPIMPVLIKCHPSALKKSDKWYNIPDGGPNFSLISGDMLFLSDCIDISKAKTLQYRELTRYLEQHYQRWMAIDSPKTINNTKDTC